MFGRDSLFLDIRVSVKDCGGLSNGFYICL